MRCRCTSSAGRSVWLGLRSQARRCEPLAPRTKLVCWSARNRDLRHTSCMCTSAGPASGAQRQAVLRQDHGSLGTAVAASDTALTIRLSWRSAQKRSALLCLPLCSNAFTMRNIFASWLGRPRTSTTHGEQTQTHAPQIMPQRSMPATPTLDQSPLQGLRHRPARSPRPTTPSALPLRSATPLRSKWERRALERFQPMAHQLVDLIKRTRGHAALSAQQQSAMTLLNRIRACAAGEKSPSGGDDIDTRISRIRDQIDRYYQKPPNAGQASASTIGASPDISDEEMGRTLAFIDLSFKAERSGGQSELLKPVMGGLSIRPEVAALAANMLCGYETGINPPTEDIARRMQNLLKHLVEGAPVAQVVYEAIITGNTRHDATQLIAALRPLLQHFPTLGNNPDWRARQ